MADDADRSLVPELRARKPEAWARAYDSHAGDLFAFIAHLLPGDRAAAEEILQDTWLAALSGIAAFDSTRGDLRGWMFGIARRQVAWHLRRCGQNRSDQIGNDDQSPGVIDSGAILPHDVLSSIERADAVQAALAELGAETRDVLLAKYVDGQSVNDLAQQFGRSPKAIESLLSRARARMRQLLAWYFDAEKTVKDVSP
jgi:RNA polymerase sigma-70 factor, ECF subfamily